MTTDTFSSSSFAGKVGLVTGATQGLGETTARLMASRGAEGLVIVGRNQERGAAVAQSITDTGCRTVFVPADLGAIDDVQQVIATLDAEFGVVHAVANCAALTERGSVWDTTPEFWDQMMAVNARAPMFIMQGCAHIMKREGVAGSMMVVGSVAAWGGMPKLLPYSASKGALIALVRNAAFALSPDRIRVNLLNLGWMNTPNEHQVQRAEGQPEDWLEQAEARMPFGRLISTDEAARSICYLLSDESGMMTGATLDFDQSVPGAGEQPINFAD